MKDKQEEIDELLYKYLCGSYTAEELHILIKLLDTTENLMFFDEIAFDQWAEINDNSNAPDEVKKELLRKEALDIIRKPGKVRSINGKRQVFARVAAILVVVLLLPVLIYSGRRIFSPHIPAEKFLTTLIRPGEKEQLTLADGTQVSLNSESEFQAPQKFLTDVRKVNLRGEAFFKVTHDATRPFIVNSGKTTIKVIGTSFDVKNYNDDNYTYITVTTGKVAVTVNSGKETVFLVPDEQLIFDKNAGTYKKIKVNSAKYSLWRKGSLYFNAAPIGNVIKTISRWYGKPIVLNDTTANYLISGEHDNKSLEAVLEAISFSTGLKYTQTTERIILYK